MASLERMCDLMARVLHRAARSLEPKCPHGAQLDRQGRAHLWREANGDRTLRVDYDLSAESIVLDVGGYEGQWASEIFSRYCCYTHVFEPVPDFAARIRARFMRNRKIQVHPFGLAGSRRRARIALLGDGSSVFREGAESCEIEFVEASQFFCTLGVSPVALMKINIEGGEYELLEHLIDRGLIRRIENLQVQFHEFVPNARKRMETIQQQLEATHTITFQYPFVWENWQRRALDGP